MGWLGDDRYYAALEAETAGFAEAVHDADPAGARRLGQAVREVGPQTEVWSWSQDHTAGFWLRRTTHDTLVHRRRGRGRRGLSGSAGPGSRPVPGRRRSRRSGWRCGSPG